jgi:hypothetical protein
VSVGKKVETRGVTEAPQRTYRVVCVNEKFKIVKEIETHIRVFKAYYYVRHNLQNYWLYDWEGPEARYAILLFDPTYDIY